VTTTHETHETHEQPNSELVAEYIVKSGCIERAVRGISEMFTGIDVDLRDVVDVDKLRERFTDVVTEIYADTFTAVEMRDALAWMDSESGKSTQAKSRGVEERVKQAMGAIFKECER
jgi:hypothetical protein